MDFRDAARYADWSLAQCRLVMASIDEGIVLFDLAGRIVAANKAAQQIVGVRFEDMFGRVYGGTSPYRMTREDGTTVEPNEVSVSRVLVSGRPELDEILSLPNRGGASWVRLDARPVGSADPATGRPRFEGVVCVITDITQRVETERALRESEVAYRLIAENSTDIILRMSPEAVMRYVSPASLSVLGYHPDELVGRPTFDLMVPDEQVPAIERHAHRYETDEPSSSTNQFIRKDGGIVWLETIARPYRDPVTGELSEIHCVARDVTARIEYLQVMQESEEMFRLLAENSTDMITRRTEDGIFSYVSPAARTVLGYQPEELVGTRARDLLDPDERDALVAIHRMNLQSVQPTTSLARFRHKLGHYVWLESTMVAVHDPQTGVLTEMQTSSRDVTARVAADAALRESEQRWRVALARAPIGVALAGTDATLQMVNSRLAQMLGFAVDELLGRTLLEVTHPDDLPMTLLANDRLREGLAESYELEKRYLTKSGEVVWARTRTTVLRDDSGVPYQAMVLVEDVTEARLARDLLEHRSLHDAVTELPNRSLMTDRLEQALRRSRPNGRVGVLYCDLDRFKTVNASVGHERGDDVLREVAARFTASIHETDTIARLSGDEFVIICEDVGCEKSLGELADAVAASLRSPMSVGGKPYTISVSIGATLADADLPANQILDEAESAMLVAKRTGRSRREIFDAAQRDRTSVDRLSIESELHAALAEGQLRLHYQPIVEIAGRRVVGYEALVRWQHPTRGLLGPADFLPIAEDSALMGPIGAWVLDQATRTAAAWTCSGADPLVPWVSVNVSAQQLGRPEMVPSVERALLVSGLPASRLKLEVTETALFAGAGAAMADLHRLSDLGVAMALDDFGTGFSSLTLLRDVPVSVLKLDRSFVARIGQDAGSTAIVQAVIALGDMLGLATVAEGVETVEQAELLQSFGCRLAQGYLFGRPAPLDS
jgi:diguanylate cyclase (GGDEF)-like protein/PAS domain S-box-containing protein